MSKTGVRRRIIPTYVGNTVFVPLYVIAATDHPHIRGEHQRGLIITCLETGSSPHTWGKLPPVSLIPGLDRIIPTYVGNTAECWFDVGDAADHPHIRGEHDIAGLVEDMTTGSSPHTWGTRHCQSRNFKKRRIIPTYVGNTKAIPTRNWEIADHPHIRGEHIFQQRQRHSSNGSSPHTWGTLSGKRFRDLSRRIIPTYVGNTEGIAKIAGVGRDHPHIRGEHMSQVAQGGRPAGSSPHTWGTQVTRPRDSANWRIIPTYVGNTLSAPRRGPLRTDHPHIRGEHLNIYARAVAFRGSSPHTWGTPVLSHKTAGQLRIIPTYVGNTPARSRWETQSADHPHIRGEHRLETV